MGKLLKFLFGLIIVVVIGAVVGRLFFFELGKTQSYSMVPTLIAGDVFVVRNHGLVGEGGNDVCESVGLGDIGVFRNPDVESELIALRVIGVPGDEVSFWRNHVKINEEVVQHSSQDPVFYVDRTSGEEMEYAVNVAEELIGGRLFHVALMDRAGGKEARKIVVPEGEFFVAGDNRNMSVDSRNFGTIPIESCIGKAVFLLWPGEDSGDLKRTQRLLSLL
jgi:signal peptidase I